MHDVRPFLPAPFENPGTLLYIGFRSDACSWLPELHEAGNEITVLEVHAPNLTSALGDSRVARFIWGDVRQVDGAAIESKYDYVWWWHGPEHIEKHEFAGVLQKLIIKTRRVLALASPWGLYPQGPHQGNVHEIHRWSVYEVDFIRQGLTVKADGQKDQLGSEIVGWMGL